MTTSTNFAYPTEANYRLIDAAPELLASVREFVELYKGLDDAIGDRVKGKVLRARAALARVDGAQ